jgi:hypothetical protein
MPASSARDWLDVWEAAGRLSAVERPLALLRGAGTATPDDALPDLPLGCRDALLLDLRAALFGPTLQSTVACPSCATVLELDVPIASVRVEPERRESVPLTFDIAGVTLNLRLPTTRDLRRVVDCPTIADARTALIKATITATSAEGASVAAEELPGGTLQAALERMRAADPQATVTAELTCPGCGTAWEADVDIAQYLWRELDHWAGQLLQDIHELASAYGWSESDVLALSAGRRQRYLELISS